VGTPVARDAQKASLESGGKPLIQIQKKSPPYDSRRVGQY
jgi:hypothetical protein